MSLSEMAGDVVRYADKKNLDRFTLVGHSMGGKVAMNVAMLYPNRIDGVIIVDIPPRDTLRDPKYQSRSIDNVFLFCNCR